MYTWSPCAYPSPRISPTLGWTHRTSLPPISGAWYFFASPCVFSLCIHGQLERLNLSHSWHSHSLNILYRLWSVTVCGTWVIKRILALIKSRLQARWGTRLFIVGILLHFHFTVTDEALPHTSALTARYWRVVVNLIWNVTNHEGCAGWLWLSSHWAVWGKIVFLCWKNVSSSPNNFVHVSCLLLTDTKSVENQVAFTLEMMLQSKGTSARRLPLFEHEWRKHFPLEHWRGPFTLTGSLGVCCQASVKSCDVFDVVSHFDVPLSLHGAPSRPRRFHENFSTLLCQRVASDVQEMSSSAHDPGFQVVAAPRLTARDSSCY